MTSPVQQHSVIDAALIGMSMRVPGAASAPELWQVLLAPGRGHHYGVERGPITQTLVRQLAAEALADASLPARALRGTRTGVYVCTHPDSRAEPGLATDLHHHFGLSGTTTSDVLKTTAVPLLHTVHLDLRTRAVDHAILITLDELHDLTRAIALVFTATTLAERHRVYAHVTGTWTTTSAIDDDSQVEGRALHQARSCPEQVRLRQTNPLPDDASSSEPLYLPERLDVPGSVRGLVGVAATALALHHRHYPTRTEVRGLSRSGPFEVPAAVSFERDRDRRSATVLRSAPPLPRPAHHDPVSLPHMCPVSASSSTNLIHAARLRAEDVPAAGSVATLADTALEHADHHPVRAAVIADNLGEAMQGFRALQDDRPNGAVIGPRVVPQVRPQLVYVLTGLAGVHPNAGAELMRLPEYAAAVDEARQALGEYSSDSVWGPGQRLVTTQDHHHATFISQLALAAAWRARGLMPNTVVGCGTGEPAAAVLAGALSLQEGARVVAARATAVASLPQAKNLLIHASRTRLQRLLSPLRDRVHVALHLHAQLWCVAGPAEVLADLERTLREHGIDTHLAAGDGAHTPPALPLKSRLHQALRGLRPRPASRAHLVTASPTAARPLRLDATYWAAQICAPPHLGAALRLATDTTRPSLIVEVAARSTLARPLMDAVASRHDVIALTSDPTQFAHALGELYIRGHTPQPVRSRANANIVLQRPAQASEDSSLLLGPAPEHTQDFLLRLVARIADSKGSLAHTWADLDLSEYDLVRLVRDLRQVPAWRDLTTADVDPHQPLSVLAKALATRLEAA